jgi:DNA polymerase-3 subunit delta'
MIEEERLAPDRIDGVPLPDENELLVQHGELLERVLAPYREGSGHHALLLTGTRGVGKATFAFSMARHLLGDSEAVRGQVARGAHPNIMHLSVPWDEKTKKFRTQIPIDHVRNLQHFFTLTAGAGGRRIGIIDAADDLNNAGANALLKLLEEPPKGALIFVLSHSPGRLLPTVRSRCQHVRLEGIAAQTIAETLPKLQPEGSPANDARIASAAGGSMRRALVLRDGKLMDDYAIFERLVAANASGSAQDWLLAHKVADSLAPVARLTDHALFLDLTLSWIAERPRAARGASLSAVAGWAEVWESMGESIRLADAYNLDRKQVILNLFSAIFAQNGRFPAAA